MNDKQDISYKPLGHYDCKSYKQSKKYIEKNRALMVEVGIKPQGKFKNDSLDWLYNKAKKNDNKKNNYEPDILIWSFILGFFALMSVFCSILLGFSILGLI